MRLWFRAGFLAALCLQFGMASYGAPATFQPPVTLLEYNTHFDVNRDGTYVQTLHVVEKAENSAGAQAVGQQQSLFIPSMQELDILEAYTLKSNGTKLPVDPSAIYEQQAMAPAGIAISDMHIKTFFFPQLMAGDTVVYTLRIRTKYPQFVGVFSYGNAFSPLLAYKQVRETISAPGDMELHIESHDVHHESHVDGDKVVHTWTYSANAVKADKASESIRPENFPRFYISSLRDYATLGNAYATASMERIVVTPKVQALADQIVHGISDRRGQTRAIYEWVSTHIRYVGIVLDMGRIIPHDTETILANGFGDCKDHDVLLQALLKAKGIATNSILLNLDGGYTLTDVAMMSNFNHVITYVPEFDLYLDSSNGFAPFGVLPWSEYGKPAVRVAGKSSQRITLPTLRVGTAKSVTTVVQKLSPDGTITGKVTTTADGPPTIDMHQFAQQVQMSGPESVAEKILAARGFKDGQGSIATTLPTSLAPQFSMTATYTVKGWDKLASGAEKNVIPVGIRFTPFPGDGPMGSFSDEETDTSAIACYSITEQEDVSLEVPKGMGFQILPKDTRVQTDTLQYTSHWTVQGQVVTVHRVFVSTYTKALCSGPMRKEINAALKKIADSYDDNFGLILSQEQAKKAAAGSPDAVKRIDIGMAFDRDGKYGEAIAQYTLAHTIEPDNFYALYNRSQSYTHLKKFDLALADLDAALKIAPDDVDALNERGYAFLNTQQQEKAEADFTRAITLKPDFDLPHYNLAFVRWNLRALPEALKEFDTAVRLSPEKAFIHMDRAKLLMNMKQPLAAMASVNTAIELEPKNPEYYFIRGTINLYCNNLANKAVEDFTKAIALNPKYAEAYKERSFARHKLGDHVNANKDIAMAIKIDPGLLKPFSADTSRPPPPTK